MNRSPAAPPVRGCASTPTPSSAYASCTGRARSAPSWWSPTSRCRTAGLHTVRFGPGDPGHGRPDALLDGESWPRLSARLAPALAARVGAVLADALTMGEHRTDDETYTGLDADLVVEVLAGSGGHGPVTVVRIR